MLRVWDDLSTKFDHAETSFTEENQTNAGKKKKEKCDKKMNKRRELAEKERIGHQKRRANLTQLSIGRLFHNTGA